MDGAFRQFFASIGKNLPFFGGGEGGGLRAGLKLMLIIDDILRFSEATRIYHVYEKFSKILKIPIIVLIAVKRSVLDIAKLLNLSLLFTS